MLGRLTALPIIVVLLDIWFGLGLNIFQSLNSTHTTAPNVLTAVPDVAFNWLQVMVNAGMVVIITFSLVILLQLNKAMSQNQAYALGPFRLLGLFLTLAFSLPALYGFSMTVTAVATRALGHFFRQFALFDNRFEHDCLCHNLFVASIFLVAFLQTKSKNGDLIFFKTSLKIKLVFLFI